MFNVVNSYLDDVENKELEVRFSLYDAELFKTVYNAMVSEAKSGQVTKSVVALVFGSGRDGNKRKEVFFGPKDKKTETYGLKRRGKIWFSPQKFYKVVESVEKPIEPFAVRTAKIIRFRLRSSLSLPDFPEWRFDFTVVKEIGTSEMNQLKHYKSKMFPTSELSISNFLNAPAFNMAGSKVELEVEHVGSSKDASKLTEDIKAIVAKIQKTLGQDVEEFSEYHTMVYELASFILKRAGDDRLLGQYKQKKGLKELSNNPRTIGKHEYFNYILPKIDDFFLSDKADGVRCFIALNTSEHQVAVLTGSDLLTGDEIKAKIGKPSMEGLTILDAELVNLDSSQKKGSSVQHKFYVFDVLAVNGLNVSHMDFEQREAKIKDAIAGLGPSVVQKIMVRLDSKSYKDQIKSMLHRKDREYKIDGLVFTPAKYGVAFDKRFNFKNHYYDMRVYKYKPADENTIDFLAIKVPNTVLGKKPYVAKPKHTLYFLFCGIKYRDQKALNLDYVIGYREMMEGIPTRSGYYPIQFSPSAHPYAFMYYHPSEKRQSSLKDLNMQIVECKFEFGESFDSPINGHWKVTRIREDKEIGIKNGTSFGNDFRIAEKIFMQILNPLTEQDLYGDTSVSPYFAKSKTEAFKPLTKLNNFAKAQVLRQVEGMDWVVDLGSGKGQDLMTYNCFKIKNGVFVEVDKQALEELVRRKYLLGQSGTCIYASTPDINMHTYVVAADLTEPFYKTVSLVESVGLPALTGKKGSLGADAVVINLAIHYLLSDAKAIQNFVNLVDHIVRPGGLFLFTTFNGEKIFEILKKIKSGKSLDMGSLSEGQTKAPKYSIRKLYPDSVKTMKPGLKIAVKHHFAGGEYYEENLVPVSDLINKFKALGFQVRQNSSFADWVDKFKQFNRKFAPLLTKDDLAYSSLYQYVSLHKTSK